MSCPEWEKCDQFRCHDRQECRKGIVLSSKTAISKKHEVCPDYSNCDDIRCQRMSFCLELKIMIGRNAVEKQLASGLTKKEIRKQHKAEKKEMGRQ